MVSEQNGLAITFLLEPVIIILVALNTLKVSR